MKFLVLNSGSSSQKACLFQFDGDLPTHRPAPLWEGKIEWNSGTATALVKNSTGGVLRKQFAITSRKQILEELLTTLWSGEASAITSRSDINAVGHRVVHGGPDFADPILITPEVREAIAGIATLAPLHISAELEGIDTIQDLFGAIPQIAVFDTGFHRRMPLAATVYPGPYEWFESGIRRYGFHGINHQYCLERSAELLGRNKTSLKLITCHLGNGCSVAAIDGGRSVGTTMGFTPLDGLMMGTRSGAVDPGILTFLMRERHVDAAELDNILNQKSGLAGISGISGDMRDILEAIRGGNSRAKLAFDIYIYRLRQAIGGMAAVLGGLDALVFTAGVGENSADVRAAACRGMEFMGIALDSEANARPALDADVSRHESRVRVLVIRAQEDRAIGAECWKLTHRTEMAAAQIGNQK